MNKIINKFLLNGNKFMTELHLKQLGFTYNTCGLKKLRETGNLKYLYRNELNKACLLMIQHILKAKIYLRELFQIRF